MNYQRVKRKKTYIGSFNKYLLHIYYMPDKRLRYTIFRNKRSVLPSKTKKKYYVFLIIHLTILKEIKILKYRKLQEH